MKFKHIELRLPVNGRRTFDNVEGTVVGGALVLKEPALIFPLSSIDHIQVDERDQATAFEVYDLMQWRGVDEGELTQHTSRASEERKAPNKAPAKKSSTGTRKKKATKQPTKSKSAPRKTTGVPKE